MSPRLHKIIYGFHPHNFGQTRRWGGWRPVVFMEHGLMVGMWMSTACLAGWHLLRTGQLSKLLHKQGLLVVLCLFAVTILCKSTGALLLLILGLFTLRIAIQWKKRFPLVIISLLPVCYIILRISGLWTAQDSSEILLKYLPEERVESLIFRFDNEDILMAKAKLQPYFGWGRWRRSFVYNESGKASVPDGMWILIFGQNGYIGLIALFMALLLPQLLALRRYPPASWEKNPNVKVAISLILLLGLFTIDGLLNNMYNPMATVISGGLASLCILRDKQTFEKPQINQSISNLQKENSLRLI
ncbi:MAG: hypothetical protein HRT89_20495 [Lentisphaeria bacterium]|nr:hypothetical protein [Lentisphaeria bacterium]